jgi:hypothetical protein
MTRILSRFTRDDIHALVELADFTLPAHAKLLEQILYDRQRRILSRYFSRLSPLADVEVRGDALCAVDLARRTRIYPQDRFQYRAEEGEATPLAVRSDGPDSVCVPLAHRSASPGSPAYRIVSVYNGATPGALQVHLYDLGAGHGFQLAGLERK